MVAVAFLAVLLGVSALRFVSGLGFLNARLRANLEGVRQ